MNRSNRKASVIRHVRPAVALVVGWHMIALPAAAAVPPPSETPAVVIVHGRTSTLKSAVIVNVGKEIPQTFSGARVANTEGFTWYASQHYALKTDYPEPKARYYLELLELTYPHYVELFGCEPRGIHRKRMTVVYGSTKKAMIKAGRSDGFDWKSFGAGGVTMPGYNIAYQYPSGALAYHLRYILIHECTHLYQHCIGLRNPWHSSHEAIAEWIGHHVYDDTRKQLTVGVLDKAAIANQLEAGRRQLLSGPTPPTGQALLGGGWGGYQRVFMVAQFLFSRPDYEMKANILRDESLRLGEAYDDKATIESLFAPWDEVNRNFDEWFWPRTNTFHHVHWSFEQEGGWLWSRKARKAYSRMDILLNPGDKSDRDGWRMDYPREPSPPEVGVIQRGVAEPSVGCMLDLSRHPHHGRVGMALGVVDRRPTPPFPQTALFRDSGATIPGLDLTIHALASVTNGGLHPEDAIRGELLVNTNVTVLTSQTLRKAAGKRRRDFVAEWRGWLKIDETETYAIDFGSDDGGWLWIDDTLVAEHGGYHGIVTHTGHIRLTAGLHPLRAVLFQKGGAYGIEAGPHKTVAHTPGMLRILVEDGKRLLLEAANMGATNQIVSLPQAFLDALARSGHILGMNLKIALAELEVTLTTTASENHPSAIFETTLPLNSKQRDRLLYNRMSLLSRYGEGEYMDVHFGIMPFVDVGWEDSDDPLIPAPANRYKLYSTDAWRAVHKACWRLGEFAPPLLIQHKTRFARAANTKPRAQKDLVEELLKDLPDLIKAITSCPAPGDSRDLALADLRGGRLSLDIVEDRTANVLKLSVVFDGLQFGDANARLTFQFFPLPDTVTPPSEHAFVIHAGKPAILEWELGELNTLRDNSFEVRCHADLEWQEQHVSFSADASYQPGIPSWYVIGPFDNNETNGWASTDTVLPPETEPFDASKDYVGHTNQAIHWIKAERGQEDSPSDDYVISFNRLLDPGRSVAAYAITWVEAPRDMDAIIAFGSEDGAVVWVNRERVFSWLKGSRSYESKQNRAPIKLKQGRNEILFKVVLGSGGWVLGAHVLDTDGHMLDN